MIASRVNLVKTANSLRCDFIQTAPQIQQYRSDLQNFRKYSGEFHKNYEIIAWIFWAISVIVSD